MTNEQLLKFNNLKEQLQIIVNYVEKQLPLPTNDHTLSYINDLVYAYILNHEERTGETLNCPFCGHKLFWDIVIEKYTNHADMNIMCKNCYKL